LCSALPTSSFCFAQGTGGLGSVHSCQLTDLKIRENKPNEAVVPTAQQPSKGDAARKTTVPSLLGTLVWNCTTCRRVEVRCWEMKTCYPGLEKITRLICSISGSCLFLGIVSCEDGGGKGGGALLIREHQLMG
uniref:Uncharacterized protein n=1 Tax=Podarcis muralis TaxID=64176 RepID=A0A670J4G4_PODMU